MLRHDLLRPPLILGMAVLVSGCDDVPMQPDGPGITGSWTFTVDVFMTTGACAMEEDDPVESVGVSIIQTEDSVQAQSTWFSDGGTHTFLGTRTGNTVAISGSYLEEGALLEAEYVLTVSEDENAMTGTETWDWNGMCEESMSNVTATRN